MHGGHGCRKFYVGEVDRIDRQHQEKLPKSEYSNEEIQAGFDRLASTFGFTGTLHYLVKELGVYKEEEIERWELYRFNHKLVYLAWQSYTVKEYNKIISK